MVSGTRFRRNGKAIHLGDAKKARQANIAIAAFSKIFINLSPNRQSSPTKTSLPIVMGGAEGI